MSRSGPSGAGVADPSQAPIPTRAWAAAAAAAVTNDVLPIPASPETKTSRPSPAPPPPDSRRRRGAVRPSRRENHVDHRKPDHRLRDSAAVPAQLVAPAWEHAELVAVGVGHPHLLGVLAAAVEEGGAEADERPRPPSPCPRRRAGRRASGGAPCRDLGASGGPAPGDLRAAPRRLDRGLLVLVPDERPAERRAPEVAEPPEPLLEEAADPAGALEEAGRRPRPRRTRCPRGRPAPRAPPRSWPTSRWLAPVARARSTVAACSCGVALERSKCIWFGSLLRDLGAAEADHEAGLVARRQGDVVGRVAQHLQGPARRPRSGRARPGRARRRAARRSRPSSEDPRTGWKQA